MLKHLPRIERRRPSLIQRTMASSINSSGVNRAMRRSYGLRVLSGVHAVMHELIPAPPSRWNGGSSVEPVALGRGAQANDEHEA
eukprot:7188163-Pyramimonas_sp.AAC.1